MATFLSTLHSLNTNLSYTLLLLLIPTSLSLNEIDRVQHFSTSRKLLQYETPAPEWDILNQHTFDGWDWFLYVFSFCCAGCMCFWAGWIWHAKHVKNLIIQDKDVMEYSTPISPSRRKNDYPSFPDSAWEKKSPPATTNNSKLQAPTYKAPKFMVTDTNGQKHKLDKRELGHLPQLSLHSAVSVDEVLTYKTKNSTILMMPIETTQATKKKVPSSRNERNVSMPHIKLQNIAIPVKKQETIKEETVEDVPEWNGQIGNSETIKDIKSPDENEESESHLSMNMYMRASSNPADHGDVFTPNTPEQQLHNSLSPVAEETQEKDKERKPRFKFKMPSASKMSPIKSISYEVDDESVQMHMDAENKMIYTDYDDENGTENKSVSPQMVENLTPPTQGSEQVVDFDI